MEAIAQCFGTSLDQDDFETTRSVLSPDCVYFIGAEKLIGPEAISNSYEQNMLEGRKKLDSLEWGQCRIEALSTSEFLVHFTDYLRHKGRDHIHRCTQKVSINPSGKIFRIDHLDNPEEQEKLNQFYQEVGLA
ncbi:MAG: hypothetical protein R2792_17900 [Saprospiraceae bacterium]